MKLLGNRNKGLLFVVSAPAGTGKTTLVTKLVEEFPDAIVESVSMTTRSPREGEVDGTHYNFITKEEFEKRIASGDFLEHVELYGDFYGTSREWVQSHLSQGKHVILVIDTQGALQLMERESTINIFIMPPSVEELRRRLLERRTESEEVISMRLEIAKREMELVKKYDYKLINDDLETAYQILRSILITEEHRVRNSKEK